MSDDPRDRDLVAMLSALAPAVDMAASRAVFQRERELGRGRGPRHMMLAAAAVLVVVGVASLWFVPNRAPDSIVPGIAPTLPTSPVTHPSTTSAPPVTAPDPTEPAVADTVAPVGPTDLGTVIVTERWETGVAQRRVEYRAGVGAGTDQLGMDDCTECDPVMPWAPVVVPDGRIVIADNYNSRWVVVTDGLADITAFDPRGAPFNYPIAPPVVDADGFIYALFPTLDERTIMVASEVRVYDVDDLGSPVGVYPVVNASAWSWLWIGPNGLEVLPSGVVDGLDVIVGQPATVSVVRWSLDVSPPSVTVTWQGSTRRWEFPAGWTVGGMGPAAQFDDGSVLVYARSSDTPAGGERSWVLLRPDGAATRWPASSGVGFNGSSTVTRDGLTTLEFGIDGAFEVVHYELADAGT